MCTRIPKKGENTKLEKGEKIEGNEKKEIVRILQSCDSVRVVNKMRRQDYESGLRQLKKVIPLFFLRSAVRTLYSVPSYFLQSRLQVKAIQFILEPIFGERKSC